MDTPSVEREPNSSIYWSEIRDADTEQISIPVLVESLAELPVSERQSFFFRQIGIDDSAFGPNNRLSIDFAFKNAGLRVDHPARCSYYDVYAILAPICPVYDRTMAGRQLLDALPTHKMRYAGFLQYSLRSHDEEDTLRAFTEAQGIDSPVDSRAIDFSLVRGDIPSQTTKQALRFIYAAAKSLGHVNVMHKAEEGLGSEKDAEEIEALVQRFDRMRNPWQNVSR
jgi:hypothetical protein